MFHQLTVYKYPVMPTDGVRCQYDMQMKYKYYATLHLTWPTVQTSNVLNGVSVWSNCKRQKCATGADWSHQRQHSLQLDKHDSLSFPVNLIGWHATNCRQVAGWEGGQVKRERVRLRWKLQLPPVLSSSVSLFLCCACADKDWTISQYFDTCDNKGLLYFVLTKKHYV